MANMDREKPGHTWQATVLVNQSQPRTLPDQGVESRRPPLPQEERRAFFGSAAHIMRRLLVAHARPLRKRVSITGEAALEELPDGEVAWRELGDLLTSLELIDPRLRQVVELKVFEGLAVEQIAERTGCDRAPWRGSGISRGPGSRRRWAMDATLTPEQWGAAWRLYEAVADLPEPDRERMLESSTEDPGVIRQVRTLLEGAGGEIPAEPVSRTGTRVSHYSVGERIGLGAWARCMKPLTWSSTGPWPSSFSLSAC